MANTTKGSGKTKKNFCFRNSKKETDPNNGQKNNGEKSSTAKRTSGTRKNTVREPMDEECAQKLFCFPCLLFRFC